MANPALWAGLLHPDDRERVLSEDARTEATGEPFSVEYRAFTRDGRLMWLRDEAVLVRDDSGRPLYWQGVKYDITDRKRLDEMKDSFVSTVSHELRTPLTSIKGYLEALIEDEGGSLNDEQREYAEVAYRNATRLQMLVEDLLLLSRLDVGRLKMNTEVLEVGEVLRQVEQEFSRVAQEINIALAVRAEPDLKIVGDRLRIAQVMSNLVGNALKFTPPDRRVSVSARRGHDEVIVDVVDEGVGIPAAELPRLTERFFRASTAGTVQGTGLGLAITKDIIERHGGRLEVESEEGAGSTFRVVVPVVSQGLSPAW